jgi:hypothetical protein
MLVSITLDFGTHPRSLAAAIILHFFAGAISMKRLFYFRNINFREGNRFL